MGIFSCVSVETGSTQRGDPSQGS